MIVNIFIFNHNPKNGGLFSSPNGMFKLIQGVSIFILVFSQRLLILWQFWRLVIGVGIPLILVLILIMHNPYYSFISNFLGTIPWIMFGSLRLCLEIGYIIEESSHSIIPQIVFSLVGIIIGICFIICIYFLMRILEGKKWLLTNQRLPLVDFNNKNLESEQKQVKISASRQNQISKIGNQLNIKKVIGLPKMKNPNQIEPRLRFLQLRELRTKDYLNYADYIYTTALHRHKKSANLQFHYGNFLLFFQKNWVKSQSVFKLARSSNPSVPLQFVLYCKSKEGRSSQSGNNQQSELTSMAFNSKMAQATQYHNIAKQAVSNFFENLTNPHINFDHIFPQLKIIVESEAKSRKYFGELMIMQPNNTTVLRNYARLLLDIYNDEDTAEIVLQRAEMLEDNNTISGVGLNAGNDVDLSIHSLQKKDGDVERKGFEEIVQVKSNENGIQKELNKIKIIFFHIF
ncbi:MAG: hypothetical protein EZS28_025169 [Streblomastix strix]|uniref:TmcB/TmcC TPR repeats domain-containing protein n=1 Tax=Streblomastix strix TaxID=222440 RepID=A0A5J4VA14_9EUKA|nr:MAG: hypothetical protein EZS28_025169 [Streblomastix strix]